MLLIEAALRHSLVDAADLPSMNMLDLEHEVLVLDSVARLGCPLDDTVLPSSDTATFRFAPADEIQAEANKKGHVFYVLVSDAWGIDSSTAAVRMGVGMRLAEWDPRAPECCCSADARFKLVDQEWVFVKWEMEICA